MWISITTLSLKSVIAMTIKSEIKGNKNSVFKVYPKLKKQAVYRIAFNNSTIGY